MDGLHLVADNHDISADEYVKARALLDEVRTLHLESRRYVEAHHLDPDVFLPGRIWAALGSPDHFIDWTCDLVNHVRCVSPFSGFDLMMWGRRDVPGQVDATRASALYGAMLSGTLDYRDLGERLERDFDLSGCIRRSLPDMTAFYDALVSTIPPHYHIAAPPCGGELGALHNGRIINPDVILYQRRVNALYAGGALQPIENAIASHGSANILEIGPGHGVFARALAECFAGAVNVFLVDLPFVLANSCAYLACASGTDRIGLVTAATRTAIDRPFLLIANHLVPAYERHLPDFHLVHNAISFNEMSALQVAYYFDLIDRHLAPDGTFHMAGGSRALDDQVDATAAAIDRFPNHALYPDRHIAGHLVAERPNVFIRQPGCQS